MVVVPSDNRMTVDTLDRSGSTLLETMFDSHSQVWGMGEDSIFNGNLTFFRDQLVQASSATSGLSLFLAVGLIEESFNIHTPNQVFSRSA